MDSSFANSGSAALAGLKRRGEPEEAAEPQKTDIDYAELSRQFQMLRRKLKEKDEAIGGGEGRDEQAIGGGYRRDEEKRNEG